MTLRAQFGAPFELERPLPVGHYMRKGHSEPGSNRRRAACIYETGDNSPLSY
jgi:hypothetical protein